MNAETEQLHDLADESEATAEQLVARGEELLSLGRRLLAQAAQLRGEAVGLGNGASLDEAVSEDRSVGRLGAVNFGTAVATARELKSFTRAEFQEHLGLNTGQSLKWLQRLINNKPHPIVSSGGVGRGSFYEYIEPVDTITEHPKKPTPETKLIGVEITSPRGRQVANRTIPKTSDPDINRLLRIAKSQDWRIERDRTNHISCYAPGSQRRVGVSSSPNKAAYVAIRKELINQGLVLPENL